MQKCKCIPTIITQCSLTCVLQVHHQTTHHTLFVRYYSFEGLDSVDGRQGSLWGGKYVTHGSGTLFDELWNAMKERIRVGYKLSYPGL